MSTPTITAASTSTGAARPRSAHRAPLRALLISAAIGKACFVACAMSELPTELLVVSAVVLVFAAPVFIAALSVVWTRG